MPTLHDRPAFKVVPIKKVDVYRSVVSQLDQLIAVNGLQRGDRLGSERELATQFGVSRVVIREALRALESMGKIEVRRNAGSFVADPDGDLVAARLKTLLPIGTTFIEQLVDVRAAIETKVVELVARMPDADLQPVVAVLENSERDLRLAQTVEEGSLDLRFEALLGRASGNQLLGELQRNIHRLWIDAWSACGIAPGDRAELHAEHVAILEAVRAGNVDLAVACMSDHVDRSLRHAIEERA